ncbi:uncharacterized protein BO87DRAFT_151544 [Aspergillus neoniger CBS 115656]|uniref:Secreted protein n=1 Tax=Aspergillus neoniger (strain CBS 115656) TaxID=1448310 RepID=A0A318Y8L9_ASPNB|nr:hypothetical protein BO87DRAFT_151544 [Aspergillus neoniger CBS 115656]PYH30641.1 hypothetical protein BO87DRAFT_151544 [Aspergillus neoniger CBS 115656]
MCFLFLFFVFFSPPAGGGQLFQTSVPPTRLGSHPAIVGSSCSIWLEILHLCEVPMYKYRDRLLDFSKANARC